MENSLGVKWRHYLYGATPSPSMMIHFTCVEKKESEPLPLQEPPAGIHLQHIHHFFLLPHLRKKKESAREEKERKDLNREKESGFQVESASGLCLLNHIQLYPIERIP